MDRPLRLITASPVDQLARTIEALLVVASQPLTVAELVEAAADEQERVETALGLLRERYSEGPERDRPRAGRGRLGVSRCTRGGGGVRAAVRAARAAVAVAGVAGDARDRRVPRAVHAPDVARIRGVSADSAVANLVERGLISEAGRDDGAGGAIRYRTTPLFERVFGLESLSELPRLDDLGGDVDEIRDRLVSVAEKRPA